MGVRFWGVNAEGIYAIIIANKSHANLFVMTFIGYYNLKAECFKLQNPLIKRRDAKHLTAPRGAPRPPEAVRNVRNRLSRLNHLRVRSDILVNPHISADYRVVTDCYAS